MNEDLKGARFAVGILDAALLGQGLGREVAGLVLEYAFENLNLRRVDLRVLDFNVRAIRSYEASGFMRTGIEANAVQIDGEWHDDVLMTLTDEQWFARKPVV